MEESFQDKVRRQLGAAEIKKKCCRHTLADCQNMRDEDAASLRAIYEKCRCEGCRSVLFRSLFLTHGSVTDPAKSYQLDFVFQSGEFADATQELLADCGFLFGRSERKGKMVLYLRDSTGVGDFLAMIGATGAAFDVMNLRIESDFRSNVNRQVNFDTANIEKQLRSMKKTGDAVAKLKAAGAYDRLPEEVRSAWELQEANGQSSLEELGRMMNPPISKSGVRHRLEKILRAAAELDKESDRRPENAADLPDAKG